MRSGLTSEAVVDQALRRVLRVAFRLGAFDPPEMVPFTTYHTSGKRPEEMTRAVNDWLGPAR